MEGGGGGALHLHDGGEGGDLDVETVMSGSWRETCGGEVLKLVVVDGSLNLPSLDEGMASILFIPLRLLSFHFEGVVFGGGRRSSKAPKNKARGFP